MHKGKIVAQKFGHKLIDCEYCGFKHVHPFPSKNEIESFYKDKYYESIIKNKSVRAPDLHKLTENRHVNQEREWLNKTLYKDINEFLLDQVSNSGLICDLGCGTGDFLKFMKKSGWDCLGIEPSRNANQRIDKEDVQIYITTIEDFFSNYPQYHHSFDAVSLLNVLEHVIDPIEIVNIAKKLLNPDSGILIIRVPNDFTKIQSLAQLKNNNDPWWIAIPDHINYFNHVSLENLLASQDLEVIYSTSDFPMEFFLLMGDNYIKNSSMGSICHKKRVEFELSLPDDLRRELYKKFAELGIGRNCLIFSKLKSGNEQ